MSDATQVYELEQAMLVRAKTLAEEYQARGRRSREHILDDANEKLRLREERELLAAKAKADRHLRQQVQAGELRLQADMDRLQWALIQEVLDQLMQSLTELAADEARYLPILGQFLQQAADVIEADSLSVAFNQRDLQRLSDNWEDWLQTLGLSKSITLQEQALDCLGGVLVQDEAAVIQVDNTFEGRIQRLQDRLRQEVMEQLFAGVPESGGQWHG